MNNDSFTEVTSTSWISRLGSSLKGIIIGIILVFAATVLLFWNEGRAVKRTKTLKEGSGAVITVSTETIEDSNQGRLVHLTGLATTENQLTDASFGVNSRAIKLKRIAEMYQWQEESQSEEKKKLGGGTETVTTYTYSTTWSEKPINSNQFKKADGHRNPANMPYRTEEWKAEEVTVGPFRLAQSVIDKISGYTPLELSPEYDLPDNLKNRASFDLQTVYLGRNPLSPEIGDLRVSFRQIKPLTISLIARQAGSILEPYQAKTGSSLVLLQPGEHSAEAMFTKAQQTNAIVTWLVRCGGFVLMLIGFQLILAPLSVFTDVIPALGTLVGAGTGLIAGLFAAFLASLTIAFAWMFYRPIIGIIMLLISAGSVAFFVVKLRKTRAGMAASPPPPPPNSAGPTSRSTPPPLNRKE